MFDQLMIETETAEVNILDVDSDTLKILLEFIYTGKESNLIHFIALKLSHSQQVAEEKYTAELLYAADKYELDELVNVTAP